MTKQEEYWNSLQPMNIQIDDDPEQEITMTGLRYKAELLQAHKAGYDQAAKDIIVKLADYLHMSLTFEDPIRVFNRLMEKK